MTRRRIRKNQPTELSAAVGELRRDAKAKGQDKLTMREINKIIADYRRERDPLSGRVKRITVTLSERMYREAKAAAESTGWDLGMLVRQAIGDYLRQLQKPHAAKNVIFDEPERRRIVKAIAKSTEAFKPADAKHQQLP
jgi:hypothetical protein